MTRRWRPADARARLPIPLATAIALGIVSTAPTAVATKPPESPWPGARITIAGARLGHYTLPGPANPAIEFNAPPADNDGTITLRLVSLETGRETQREFFHPAHTTASLSWNPGSDLSGKATRLLTARRVPERWIAWSWTADHPLPSRPTIQPPNPAADPPIVGNPPTPEAIPANTRSLARMLALFDPATTGTWLGNDPQADLRWMREDIYLVIALLLRDAPGDRPLASTILRHIAASQYHAPGDLLDGLLLYHPLERPAPDHSTTQFTIPAALWLLQTRAHLLEPDAVAAMDQAVVRALVFFKRYYNSGFTLEDFTNFQCLAIATLLIAGERHGDPDATAIGRLTLNRLWQRLNSTGFSIEFASPTYVAVSMWALGFALETLADPDDRASLSLLYERFFLEAAIQVHPQWSQLAGPYSRTFADGVLGGATLTSLVLASQGAPAVWASTDRIAPVFEANHSLDLNPSAMINAMVPMLNRDLLPLLTARPLPAQVFHRHVDGGLAACWIAPGATLGTTVARLHHQSESFLMQVRERRNPGGVSAAVLRTGGDTLPGWEEPSGTTQYYRQSAIQHGGRALIAIRRTFPAGAAPIRRAQVGVVLEERFGRWDTLSIDGQRLDLAPGTTVTLEPGQWITAQRGDGHFALKALSIPSAGARLLHGRISRLDDRLEIAFHSLDSVAPVESAPVAAETVLAIAVGENAPDQSTETAPDPYGQFTADLLADETAGRGPGASHYLNSVAAHWPAGGTNASPELDAEWDRPTLMRRIDRRDGADFLPRVDFVRTADMHMPGPQSDGVARIGTIEASGLPPGGWAILLPGAVPLLRVANPAPQPATILLNDGRRIDLHAYEAKSIPAVPSSKAALWPE